MTETSLIDATIRAGVWHGIVEVAGGSAPSIALHHAGGVLEPRRIAPIAGHAGRWQIEVALPADLLEEGVRALLITDQSDGRTLQSLTISAGAPFGDDLTAEVANLRAEVEVLKAALRRLARELPRG